MPLRYIWDGGIAPLNLNLSTTIHGGQRSASCSSCFTSGHRALLPIDKETECTPEPVQMFWRKTKFLAPLTGTEIQFTGCPNCSPVTILCYHGTYVFYNALSILFTYCKLTCKDAIIRSVNYYLYCTICNRLGLVQLKAL